MRGLMPGEHKLATRRKSRVVSARVSHDVYRELEARAALRGLNVGTVLTRLILRELERTK